MLDTINERLERLMENIPRLSKLSSDEDGLNNEWIVQELQEISDEVNQTGRRLESHRETLQLEDKQLRIEIRKYKALASMSDAHFSDELDTQIEYCRRADEEGENYGASCDIHILQIARDRLRR